MEALKRGGLTLSRPVVVANTRKLLETLGWKTRSLTRSDTVILGFGLTIDCSVGWKDWLGRVGGETRMMLEA